MKQTTLCCITRKDQVLTLHFDEKDVFVYAAVDGERILYAFFSGMKQSRSVLRHKETPHLLDSVSHCPANEVCIVLPGLPNDYAAAGRRIRRQSRRKAKICAASVRIQEMG